MKQVLKLWLFAALFVPCTAFAQSGNGSLAERGIGLFRVTGEATVIVAANLATVSVGVETKNDFLDRAMELNASALQTTISELRQAGFMEADIATSEFQISEPDYFLSENEPRPPTYEVSNRLNVTVRNLDTLGSILYAVTEVGANDVSDLSFTVEDGMPHRSEARQLAVQDARKKAELYSKAAGVMLGRLLHFTEGNDVYATVGILEAEPIMAEPVVASVPIANAEVRFHEEVTLIYEIIE